MVDISVTVRRKLNVLGVVAVLAGAVGIPADLGAGWGFRVVVNIAVSSRNLDILGVVAILAGAVSVPADFGAGWGFRVVVNIAVSSRNLNVLGIVAILAGAVGVPADLSTGGSFCFMFNESVAVVKEGDVINENAPAAVYIRIESDLHVFCQGSRGERDLGFRPSSVFLGRTE